MGLSEAKGRGGRICCENSDARWDRMPQWRYTSMKEWGESRWKKNPIHINAMLSDAHVVRERSGQNPKEKCGVGRCYWSCTWQRQDGRTLPWYGQPHHRWSPPVESTYSGRLQVWRWLWGKTWLNCKEEKGQEIILREHKFLFHGQIKNPLPRKLIFCIWISSVGWA